MHHWVLGIGYGKRDFEDAQKVWLRYGVLLEMADTSEEAIVRLAQKDYICVTICADDFDYSPWINQLRKTKPVPIIVLSPQYDAEHRARLMQMGAMQYITHTGKMQSALESGMDGVRYYLNLAEKGEDPLTVLTGIDIILIYEYRSVMVGGKEVILTQIEYEILYLLMSQPRRVFSYDIIMDRIWGEDYVDTSVPSLWTHVNRLRQKLKVTPETPDYIHNIRGIGYKFADY